MTKRQLALTILTLLFSALLPFSVIAQETKGGSNLQILDSTMSESDLIDIMSDWSGALGVRCSHCHIRKAGPDHEYDFASDSLKPKLQARHMLRMTNLINDEQMSSFEASDSQRVVVECITCHRGQERPRQLQDVLSDIIDQHGMDSAKAKYRELRDEYYGRHTYDFGDRVLAHLAIDVSQVSNVNALTILKLNEEFNPESSFNHYLLGQVYTDLGDTVSAIASYERTLELNPKHRRAGRLLESLRNPQQDETGK